MTAPATQTHEDDVLGKAYDRKLMRRLLIYTRPYRALMYGAFALLCVEGGVQVVGPLLTRRVIDVAVPTHNVHIVVVSTALLLLALVAEFVTSYGQTWLTSLLGQRVMRDLRMEIFEHLQRLSVSFFDRNPAGRLITRVTSDVETLNELFTSGVVSGLGDLFTLIAISVAMLIMDWRLALASFAVIPFVVMVSGLFRKGVRNTYRDIRVRLARINSFLQERLTGMRIVQLFGQEKREAQRFDELNRSHLDANLKSITVYALYFPAIELLTSIALAILIVAGASRVHAGVLSVGTVAAFLQLVRRFFQPLQDLSEKYNILQTAMASSERIFTLLDTVPSVPDRVEPVEVLKEGAGVEVAFEDVWFAYDVAHMALQKTGAVQETPTVEWVLKGVSFTARPGETLALVGHTGAGKTTIVNLLMRFYDPQRGRITINGIDIRTMPLDELRSLIGYVQQDIFLFAGDITTNIRLSNPLSDEEVVKAAAKVGADRIIRGFPQGYGQVLGERGASISVGERQLLSFARAVAQNAPLLLLDEATSAVDSEIEAEIHAALSVLVSGRTTIAVAHRLSTIANADMILVLHHGEVAERGTHRELLDRGGLYNTLWRLQAGDAEPLLKLAG
ncbi:MAG TPA: ABC transporter ATP-binding protein [Gemmatimonadaceae bacterium]|jgi:ATP-binding cassette subfamily B protein|nr:ABC transporter ATP-binding protein [Gemmatimonadaceae bacterium]